MPTKIPGIFSETFLYYSEHFSFFSFWNKRQICEKCLITLFNFLLDFGLNMQWHCITTKWFILCVLKYEIFFLKKFCYFNFRISNFERKVKFQIPKIIKKVVQGKLWMWVVPTRIVCMNYGSVKLSERLWMQEVFMFGWMQKWSVCMDDRRFMLKWM